MQCNNTIPIFIFPIGLVMLAGMILLTAMLIANEAHAADANFVSDIVTRFYDKASSWTSRLQEYARRLFALFLTIEVVVLGIRGSVDSTQIREIFKTFLISVIFAGFMLSVINYYPEWSANVINGMSDVALELGGVNPTSSPFEVGLEIIRHMTKKLDILEPVISLGIILVAFAIFICFALITAQVVFIICESYVASYAAIILLGFGGFSNTREFAFNTMRYALSVAFKLFVLQLILGIGLSIIQEFATSEATSLSEMFTVMGCAVILLALVKSIPDVCGGIISGSHMGSGLAMAAAVSSMAHSGAMLAAGVKAIGSGTGKISSTGSNLKKASELANMSGATGLSKAAHMAGNLRSARQQAKQEGVNTKTIMQERLEAARMSKSEEG